MVLLGERTAILWPRRGIAAERDIETSVAATFSQSVVGAAPDLCEECYIKRDMNGTPWGDDLATLKRDLLVAEAGWGGARLAPNPALLVRSVGPR